MLGPDDDLPHRPRRVLVAGTTGAGKTTLAVRVADVLGLPRVELDALHHGPGWVPRETFLTDVESFSASGTWVSEWQYPDAKPLLAARADLLVWLDLPTALKTSRVVRRTVRRRLRREELWNGNVEPPLRTFWTDPDHVVRWAWRTRRNMATEVPDALAQHPTLVGVRLRRRRDVERWLGGPLARV